MKQDEHITSSISSDPSISFEVPAAAQELLSVLEGAHFESWLVGGFVRDSLRNTTPHDCDIATQAPWQQTEMLCNQAGFPTYQTGIKHGTLSVNVEGSIIEVTTFRKEGSYSDHRHPDCVEFVDSITTDLARRDFTINAMAYHPMRGLYDPFDGRTDLANGIIRCVGDARTRFDEDALRIVRALRFAAQLGFTLEPATEAALCDKQDLLRVVAVERIATELEKMICKDHIKDVLIRYIDIIGLILPELLPMKDFNQRTPYHIYDVLEHTAHVVSYSNPQPTVRWAALFHDSGKPTTFTLDEKGIGHMYGHSEASESLFLQAAKRLRLPRQLTNNAALLIRYHDTFPAPTKKSVRKLYRRLNYDDGLFYSMCNLMRADARSKAPLAKTRLATIDGIEQCFTHMRVEEEVFSVKDLAINGNDIISCGVHAGPKIGALLDQLTSEVEEEAIKNTRDALIARTRELLSKN